MFAYQCSQLSTPESIIGVFNQAIKVQKNSNSQCISVVVLDEVGLAEDSSTLPLKALHPLLEDGTDSAKAGDDHSFEDVVRLHVLYIGEISFKRAIHINYISGWYTLKPTYAMQCFALFMCIPEIVWHT